MATANQIDTRSRRVPRRRHDANVERDAGVTAELDLLPVRERLDRVLTLESLAGLHPVRRLDSGSQRGPATHVIRVDVRVEDADDAGPEVSYEPLVPRHVPGGIDDDRLSAGTDHVR